MDSGKRIWNYFVADETKTASVVNPDETASMVLYGAINGHTLATAGYNGSLLFPQPLLTHLRRIERCIDTA